MKETVQSGDTNPYPRGSEWRKWDLHVHSLASYLNNQFGDNWDEYVQRLFRSALQKDIAALGITDYFTIDGYRKLKEEYLDRHDKLESLFTDDEITRIRNILVIPNVEFRLHTFVGQSRINCHVLFSNSVAVKDIEEHFLHDLVFTYKGEPQQTSEKIKLKLDNLRALGERLIAEHESFGSESPLVVGMKNAVVDADDVAQRLQDSRFRGSYLFGVVADEDLSRISWESQDHHTRKVLIQRSDVLFSANARTRLWALGQEPYQDGVDGFLREFRTLKPCIHGSDAHGFPEIGHPCARRGDSSHSCAEDPDGCDLRYCWIKADPTFEGLKQTLYEPDARIVIQTDNPTPIKSTYSLEAFRIDGINVSSELSLKTTALPLNADLVAVIGGKGRGKTALVDLLANSFQDRARRKDKNSFARRIADQAPSLRTESRFRNGERFEKALTENAFFEGADVAYIAQAALESYLDEESDLQGYVNNLIFQSPQIKDSVLRFEFDTIAENITHHEAALASQNETISELEQRTSDKHLQEETLKKKRIDAERADVTEKLRLFEQRRSALQIKEAKEKQQALRELRERKDDLAVLQERIRSAQAFIAGDLRPFNEDIEAINALLQKIGSDRVLPTFRYPQTDTLEEISKVAGEQLADTVDSIEKFQRELAEIEAETRRHTALLDKKAELERAAGRAQSDLAKLCAERDRLAAARQERGEKFKHLVELVLQQKSKYDTVIEHFAEKKADVLSELDFSAHIHFDEERFIEEAEDVLDGRSVRVRPPRELDGDPSALQPVADLVKMVAGGQPGRVDTLLAALEETGQKLRSKLKRGAANTVRDFYDWLYGNYLTVSPVVRYKNTQLDKLSLGQKATVLIKIYLAQDDRPIIIDSHDDHLDNQFIMDELVRAIREAKMFRQVILVSNNGNVVVNSDAEQVIIAQRSERGEISYVSGSLENKEMRDQAIQILEGGEDAFRRRQEKYRLGTSRSSRH